MDYLAGKLLGKAWDSAAKKLPKVAKPLTKAYWSWDEMVRTLVMERGHEAWSCVLLVWSVMCSLSHSSVMLLDSLLHDSPLRRIIIIEESVFPHQGATYLLVGQKGLS